MALSALIDLPPQDKSSSKTRHNTKAVDFFISIPFNLDFVYFIIKYSLFQLKLLSDKEHQMDPFFFEIHKDMPRQGPGGDIYTYKALSVIKDKLPAAAKILDVGCGPGKQTIALGTFLPHASIHAIDTHQPFLEELLPILKQHGMADRVNLSADSMDSLPFDKESFEVIWSEGAIYNMGFKKGAAYFRDFLKAEGFLVFSDLVWIKENPPEELVAYWRDDQGVVVTDGDENKSWLNQNGYSVLHTFSLPPDAWMDEYYTPLKTRLEMLRLKFPADTEKIAVIEEEEKELEIFDRFNEYFSYVYYICRKTI